jgi:anthranilate phosphoribosyltransferase
VLRALSARGETAIDIMGAADAVMQRATAFDAPEDALDVCGTGGDGSHSYNISTTVACVVAACGAPVVKHGNRSVSSLSGSSDVLSALGIPNHLTPEFWRKCMDELGIAFLYAPHFHAGLVRLAPIRKAIGTRTIFNVLGPLCNPARVKRQLMGVYAHSLVPIIADVMQMRDMEHAWVVHGEDGSDELSISGATMVAKVQRKTMQTITISPEDIGLARHPVSAIKGATPEVNAAAMLELFAGERSAYRSAVVWNSAAALIVAGHTVSLDEGAMMAAQAIDSGKTLALVKALQERAERAL